MSRGCSKPRISIEDRGRIVAYREMGYSYRAIAKPIGCSVGAVHHVIQKKQETGTVIDRHISGRKRITTQREDRIITRISLATRSKTAPRIRASLGEHHGIVLSVSTVQRRLRGVGLKVYRARKKPRLTQNHRRKRMEFALKYRGWTASEWSNVVFSDESRFQLFRNDGRPFVRRRPGEGYRDDCVRPTLKHGGGSVMVWGCMSEMGVGELRKVSGRLCAKDYVSLLRGALPTSIRSLGLGSDYTFQQDNASYHSAKYTRE